MLSGDNKIMKILISKLLVVLVIVSSIIVPAKKIDYRKMSTSRIAFFQQLVKDRISKQDVEDYGKNRRKKVVLEYVKRVGGSAIPNKPLMNEKELNEYLTQSVEKQVDEKFPLIDENKFQKQLEKKFPLYPLNTDVVVYYAPSPASTKKVTGKFTRRTDRGIVVSYKTINYVDIQAVPGNEEELLKFDINANAQIRQELLNKAMTDNKQKRDTYRKKLLADLEQNKDELLFAENVKRGYLYYQKKWMAPVQVAGRVVSDEIARVKQVAIYKFLEKEEQERLDALAKLDKPEEITGGTATITTTDTTGETVVTTENGAITPQTGNIDTDPNEGEYGNLQDEPINDSNPISPNSTKNTNGNSTLTIGGIAVGGIIVFIIIVLLLKKTIGGGDQFMPKLESGEQFMAMVNHDESFKYVAYRFSSSKFASRALKRLSFMEETSDGVACDYDLLYGYYPDKKGKKVVVFVAGEELTYAQWREASAVFPEVRGAEYFRVSSAPDIGENRSSETEATNQHNVQYVREADDPTVPGKKCRIYRADSKEYAIAFLRGVDVDEYISYQVKTDNAVFGRDIDGIFEE